MEWLYDRVTNKWDRVCLVMDWEGQASAKLDNWYK